MARLTEDLKKESEDPSSVSRVQVWIKSRTKKNGEPVSMTVANTIEKIKKVESESQSSSIINVKEDALSKVLGHDRPGRLRSMGRGITFTKLALSQSRDKQVAQCQSRISELEGMVRMLINNRDQESLREGSTSQLSKHGDKCDLLNWNGTDEIVAEGRVLSTNPNEVVNKIHLGPNAMKVIIDRAREENSYLWRPTPSLSHVGEAENYIVAWPASRVVLCMVEHSDKEDNVSKTSSTNSKCKLYDWDGSEELVAEGRLYSSDPKQIVNDIPLGPSAVVVWIDNAKKEDAYLWRPTADMSCVGQAIGRKIAWPETKVVVDKTNIAVSPASNARSAPKSANSASKIKCKLVDVNGTGEVVAEGSVSSTDPNTMVHCVPLGKNGVRVWVEIVKVGIAKIWRPNSEYKCIEDCLGTTVAWPSANVILESSSSN